MHLNKQRSTNKGRTHFSDSVSKILIHTFYKNKEIPSLKEGFDEIKEICFVAGPFESKEDEESFNCL